MQKVFVLFLLFFPSSIPAQNYQNICSRGTTFFKNEGSYLGAFRRDSALVQDNGDTLFISYTTIRDSTSNTDKCMDTTNGGLLGRRIIARLDGWVCFFNKNNDTIKLNTAAALNDSWKYCSIDNGYLEATVTGITSEDVLGLADQIKIISFQAKDLSGHAIPHIFNQKKIKLSQHYGLTDMYDIYRTPYDTLNYLLAGKTNPRLGVQPFSWEEVYDFNVGDEFHYTGVDYTYGEYKHWNILEKILTKNLYGSPDSVTYSVEYCKKQWLDQLLTYEVFDTIYRTFNIQKIASKMTLLLPDEFLSIPGQGVPGYSRIISDYNGRPVQIYNSAGYIFYSTSGCYKLYTGTYNSISHYAPGLGQTAFHFMYGGDSLVYYKKGAETWGTPFSVDCKTYFDLPEILTGRSLTISIIPNPVESEGMITIDNYFPGKPLQFGLYDRMGREVYHSIITSAFSTFSRENLPSGLYLYRIAIEDGLKAGHGKIVLK